MFCLKCGCEIKEGEKFCGNCGAPVQMQPGQGQYPQMPQQGYGYNYNYNAPQQYYNYQQVNRPQPEPMTKKKHIMNVIFVIVAIAIILGYYIFTFTNVFKMTSGTFSTLFEEYMELMDDGYTDRYEDYEDDEYFEDEEEDAGKDEGKADESEIEYVHVDAPEYKGPYNYFKGEKWFVSIEGLIVNSKGEANDKLAGLEEDFGTSRDFTEGMILTQDGFYYVNADNVAVEFAPGAKCAELAFDGGTMFYVIPQDPENDTNEFGDLYLFDTTTGKSQLLAENIVLLSPVISQDGKIVAYTRQIDKKNRALCIAGSELEEQQLEKGDFRACSVNNDGNLFYTDDGQREIFRYKDGNSAKVYEGKNFNNYFVDGDLDEILICTDDSAFYCDSEMEEAVKVYEGSPVTNMHTDGIHQVYGQFWARILDVKSLKDLFFVAKDGTVFIINSEGNGAATLKYDYDDLDNIVFDTEGRNLMYSYDGVLYKSAVKDDVIEDEVLYDEDEVENFFASYDHKNVWIMIGDDVYYLKGKELENVIPDYKADRNNEGLMFAWNVEDNKLYFTEDNTLYSVYDSESSTEVVADECSYLFKTYGKLGYLSESDDLYLNIDGEFTLVYEGY